MSDLSRPFYELSRWFAERGIASESLTVILNFTDRDEAMRFDYAMRRDLECMTHAESGPIGIGEFQMCGIRGRLESPLHTL